MANGYPSPYGKQGEDAASPVTGVPAVAPAPRQWSDFLGQAGAERRRVAKGQTPRTRAEVMDGMWGRPKGRQTPWPTVGQAVRFVRHEWGDPEAATVLEVQDPGDDDANLRMPLHKGGEALYGQPGEPAPWVTLQTADGFVTRCREARVRGAAGWLP